MNTMEAYSKVTQEFIARIPHKNRYKKIQKESDSVLDVWGIKDEYGKLIDILIQNTMRTSNCYTDTIDLLFPHLSADDKLKIFFLWKVAQKRRGGSIPDMSEVIVAKGKADLKRKLKELFDKLGVDDDGKKK